jgi:heat-inducible transcriptional repressor
LYVESISDASTLAPVEQLMIRHQFGQVAFASEQWLRLAASALASATHAAAIATPAKPSSCRVRRIDVVGTAEHTASLVLVMADGPVKQVLLNLDYEYSQFELDELASLLDRMLQGKSTREVDAVIGALKARPGEHDALLLQAIERVSRLMHEFDSAAVEEVFSEGLLNVMAEPEFERSERLRRAFGVLQDRAFLGELVKQLSASDDVRVFIGSENEHEDMNDVSLVVATYGRSSRAVGVVGVIGPTRMAYPHAISTVRYVRSLMNELVDHAYA